MMIASTAFLLVGSLRYLRITKKATYASSSKKDAIAFFVNVCLTNRRLVIQRLVLSVGLDKRLGLPMFT